MNRNNKTTSERWHIVPMFGGCFFGNRACSTALATPKDGTQRVQGEVRDWRTTK